MRKTSHVTAKRLREVISYDPDRGIFTYLTKRGSYKAGQIGGSLGKGGYIFVCIDKYPYLAHRLAWLYMNGEWPPGLIDHINCKKDDNRFCNLRLATFSQNSANASLSQDNRTGFKGIHKSKKRWMAQICHNRKRYYLGLFSTPEAAHDAYVAKAKELFGEYARAA